MSRSSNTLFGKNNHDNDVITSISQKPIDFNYPSERRSPPTNWKRKAIENIKDNYHNFVVKDQTAETIKAYIKQQRNHIVLAAKEGVSYSDIKHYLNCDPYDCIQAVFDQLRFYQINPDSKEPEETASSRAIIRLMRERDIHVANQLKKAQEKRDQNNKQQETGVTTEAKASPSTSASTQDDAATFATPIQTTGAGMSNTTALTQRPRF